jgi:hypothetical protein
MREHALSKGGVGEARVLRQDFPVEVSAVPLMDVKIVHGRAAQGTNATVIQEITKENKHLPAVAPSPITRLSWIHGNRTLNAGKKRSSLVVYFCSEAAREVAVRDGLTISGVWYSVKLWSHSLSCPRCFNCGLWGHTQSTCAKHAVCGHCAGGHDTRKCHQPQKTSCSNCGRKHKQWDRSCSVYQAARAGAEARRRALWEETLRVRTQAERRHVGGETISTCGLQQSAAHPPPRRPVGRPRGVDKAGSAVGQLPLSWTSQPTVENGDQMEEL